MDIALLARDNRTVRASAVIDEGDVALVAPYQWRLCVAASGLRYAYCRIGIGGRKVYMHRLLLGLTDGEIDHIDRNGLNNRRSNLRIATHAQNGQNRRRNGNNATGYRGVSFEAHVAKYSARIRVNNKRIRLGLYETALEAAEAYSVAARTLSPDWIALNELGERCSRPAGTLETKEERS